MFLTLDIVKKHLNIDCCFKEDDEYLTHLIVVAERAVEKHIDCDFSTLVDEEGMIPSPLLHAMLLLIGNFYQSRESIAFASTSELPLSYQYLLDMYTDYSPCRCKKPKN